METLAAFWLSAGVLTGGLLVSACTKCGLIQLSGRAAHRNLGITLMLFLVVLLCVSAMAGFSASRVSPGHLGREIRSQSDLETLEAIDSLRREVARQSKQIRELRESAAIAANELDAREAAIEEHCEVFRQQRSLLPALRRIRDGAEGARRDSMERLIQSVEAVEMQD